MDEEAVTAEQDDMLLRAFLAGDRQAFDQLVIRHKDRVFTVCYWFLGDHTEANDQAQETFIKAFRSLKNFRFESAFSTWIYRIAVNTCKNRLKSSQYRKGRKTVPLDDAVCAVVPDDCPSPFTRIENKQRRVKIQEAVDSLSPEHRSVVVLRDIQGLSYEEIADITGLGMGTVKSRLSRARHMLRELLKSEI